MGIVPTTRRALIVDFPLPSKVDDGLATHLLVQRLPIVHALLGVCAIDGVSASATRAAHHDCGGGVAARGAWLACCLGFRILLFLKLPHLEPPLFAVTELHLERATRVVILNQPACLANGRLRRRVGCAEHQHRVAHLQSRPCAALVDLLRRLLRLHLGLRILLSLRLLLCL